MSSYLRWLDPTVRQSCPHDDSEATLRVNCAGLRTKPILPAIMQASRKRSLQQVPGMSGSSLLSTWPNNRHSSPLLHIPANR